MNKANILNFILNKYEKEKHVSKEIILELRQTINEMKAAESLFNLADDPKLIECAIYKGEAAKKKFDYLLNIAKKEYNNSIEMQ